MSYTQELVESFSDEELKAVYSKVVDQLEEIGFKERYTEGDHVVQIEFQMLAKELTKRNRIKSVRELFDKETRRKKDVDQIMKGL